MSYYGNFAEVYDRLMTDVDYVGRTKYLLKLFNKFDRTPTLLLDLACGTGGFSNQFANNGIDVIGVDMSEEMLSVAKKNSAEYATDVLYLCQKAEELDLFGTVDGAVCCLDSLNHITDYNNLCKAIYRTALFLETGRLFIFDINTVFKHKHILGDDTFIIEQNDIYCVWQNSFREETLTTDISLDFFERHDDMYSRLSEDFSERAYTDIQIENALKSAGLQIVVRYADMTEQTPNHDTDRVIYVTRKIAETYK